MLLTKRVTVSPVMAKGLPKKEEAIFATGTEGFTESTEPW